MLVRSISLRTASQWAYVLAFGALFGYATYGYTLQTPNGPDTGMIWVWVVMALIGSTLLGLKNRRISNRRLRVRVTLGDCVVIIAALVLIFVLPTFIGMVKGLVLLALFTPYMLWCFRALDAAGEW
jgi:FtsH-binding integral membrane protein